MAEEQGLDWVTMDNGEKAQMRLSAREQYLATALLLGANKT
jgi:hypothetical protein